MVDDVCEECGQPLEVEVVECPGCGQGLWPVSIETFLDDTGERTSCVHHPMQILFRHLPDGRYLATGPGSVLHECPYSGRGGADDRARLPSTPPLEGLKAERTPDEHTP
jgi:hypothetical protein